MKARTLIFALFVLWLPALVGLFVTQCTSPSKYTHEICFSDTLYQDTTSEVGITAISAKYKAWDPGDTLKIFFVDGTEDQKRQALEALAVWGVQVSGVESPREAESLDLYAREVSVRANSTVRYQFQDAGGSAYVGKSAVFNTDVVTIKSSIYSAPHEWGHVLSRQHEHSSGEDPIPWDSAYVYDYMATRGWNKQMVDHNIFAVFFNNPGHTDVDAERDLVSVMHYRFPKEWVKPEGWDRLPPGPVRWPSQRDRGKAVEDYPISTPPDPYPDPDPDPEPKPCDTVYIEKEVIVVERDTIYIEIEIPVPGDGDCTLEEKVEIVKYYVQNKRQAARLTKSQMEQLLSNVWGIDTSGMTKWAMRARIIQLLDY